MSKGMNQFQLALEDAKQYQSWYQDDDFEVRLSWEAPTKEKAGQIAICAPDLQFDEGEMKRAFSLSCGAIIRTVEIEVSDGYEYWPELVLQYLV